MPNDTQLTASERNVIHLLCAGYTNETICKKLKIAYNSLVMYLVSIRKKLGVSDAPSTHPAVRRIRLAIAYWESTGRKIPEKVHKIEGLTDEEAKVVYMIATGKTNEEIINEFEDVRKFPARFSQDTLFGYKCSPATVYAKRVEIARRYWDKYGSRHTQTIRTRYPDLTKKETDIMNAICKGKTDTEIQEALQLSTKSYIKHLSDIARKLECSQKKGKDLSARRVKLMGTYLKEYRGVQVPKASHPIQELLYKEAQILRLIALGYTDKEIKEKFFRKTDRTPEYVATIKLKLFGTIEISQDSCAERIKLARWYWEKYGENVGDDRGNKAD